MQLKPHQIRAVEQSLLTTEPSVVVAPPGAGKSLMMREIVRRSAGKRILLLVERKMLLEQTMRTFESEGIEYGIRASGYRQRECDVQIAMVQTESARAKDFRWDPFQSDITLVDEAHKQTGGTAGKVIERAGGRLIGFTATPVNCGNLYKRIIDGGSYSELRACGLHVPLRCFCPDAPDTTGYHTNKDGEYSEQDQEQMMGLRTPIVYGRIIEWFLKINPMRHPSLAWAPCVASSKWLAYKFIENGIVAAHIDGESILIPNSDRLTLTERANSDTLRQELLERSESGEIQVICNRFVLREAIDMPWIRHGILACVMGGLSTYLQTLGRLQRSKDGKIEATVQDHGGNYDRHGSPNEDRNWSLGCTNKTIAQERRKKIESEKGPEAEPIICPKCCGARTHGKECPHCGYVHTFSVRVIRQTDGQLIERRGRLRKFRPVKSADDFLRSQIYRGYYAGLTAGQVMGIASKAAAASGVGAEFTIKTPVRNSAAWHSASRDFWREFRPKGKRK